MPFNLFIDVLNMKKKSKVSKHKGTCTSSLNTQQKIFDSKNAMNQVWLYNFK